MDKPIDLIEYEAMLLGRHSFTARSRRVGSKLDRSPYTLLSRLRLEGAMSIRQLAEATGLDVSTLNRQTAAMLRDGLVERIADPDGGVARKFQITDKGTRLLHHEREASIADLEKIMTDWTAADVATFADYLRRFNTDIEHHAGQPWPRP
jgi:DNA-binding MarR family transcriptional regulator